MDRPSAILAAIETLAALGLEDARTAHDGRTVVAEVPRSSTISIPTLRAIAERLRVDGGFRSVELGLDPDGVRFDMR